MNITKFSHVLLQSKFIIKSLQVKWKCDKQELKNKKNTNANKNQEM
jgi:hypothetical protein